MPFTITHFMSETYYSTFSINSDESNLIRVFDDDNSGAMDFAEYMLAINATNLNTPQACFVKLVFSLYHRS